MILILNLVGAVLNPKHKSAIADNFSELHNKGNHFCLLKLGEKQTSLTGKSEFQYNKKQNVGLFIKFYITTHSHLIML